MNIQHVIEEILDALNIEGEKREEISSKLILGVTLSLMRHVPPPQNADVRDGEDGADKFVSDLAEHIHTSKEAQEAVRKYFIKTLNPLLEKLDEKQRQKIDSILSEL